MGVGLWERAHPSFLPSALSRVCWLLPLPLPPPRCPTIFLWPHTSPAPSGVVCANDARYTRRVPTWLRALGGLSWVVWTFVLFSCGLELPPVLPLRVPPHLTRPLASRLHPAADAVRQARQEQGVPQAFPGQVPTQARYVQWAAEACAARSAPPSLTKRTSPPPPSPVPWLARPGPI
jgi:hypothetical protein